MNTSLISTSCDPVARMPCTRQVFEDLDTGLLERHAEVDHGWSGPGIVVDAGCHQDVTGRDAARKHFAAREPKSALDLCQRARNREANPRPPLEMSTSFSSATRLRIFSGALSPERHR